jgi:hypothetical protein
MLGKNGQMPPLGVPKVTAIVPAASPSCQKRGEGQNSRHFVSHLGDLGRRLTLTLQKYGKAGCREASVVPIHPLLGQRIGQQGRIGWQGRSS